MTDARPLLWIALLGALAAACTFGDDDDQSTRTYTYTASPTPTPTLGASATEPPTQTPAAATRPAPEPTAYLGDLAALRAADASLGLVVATALDGDPDALLAHAPG